MGKNRRSDEVQMTSGSGLLPCPFCGKPSAFDSYFDCNGEICVYVRCSECGGRTIACVVDMDLFDDNPVLAIEKAQAMARESWNQRTNEGGEDIG